MFLLLLFSASLILYTYFLIGLYDVILIDRHRNEFIIFAFKINENVSRDVCSRVGPIFLLPLPVYLTDIREMEAELNQIV